MPKFRKKPVEIEARKLIEQTSDEIRDWITREGAKVSQSFLGPLTIHTLEGDMQADLGDWVIKGTRGEFYPVKPGPFADTFEQVED